MCDEVIPDNIDNCIKIKKNNDEFGEIENIKHDSALTKSLKNFKKRDFKEIRLISESKEEEQVKKQYDQGLSLKFCYQFRESEADNFRGHYESYDKVRYNGDEIYYEKNILTSKYHENEIIKKFLNKIELVEYIKYVLSVDEQCKIVINSSKPKAIYFQCERSGSFRTTVKDSSKRQRIAYTKRNKCGYRLVANFFPPEKNKKKKAFGMKTLDLETDERISDVLGLVSNTKSNNKIEFMNSEINEFWILRMINPVHNHPPDPKSNKKKKLNFSRTLVEKPLQKTSTKTKKNNNSDLALFSDNNLFITTIDSHLKESHNSCNNSDIKKKNSHVNEIKASPLSLTNIDSIHNHIISIDPNIDQMLIQK